MENDKRLAFLWSASELFKPNKHVNKLLKSYYLTNIKEIVGDKLISTSNQFGDQAMCRKCSGRWYDGNFVVNYAPSRVKGSRAQKFVDALNKGEKMSKKQKVRAKWYRKRIKSSVVLTCNLCHHKTPLYLDKPHRQEKEKEKKTDEVETKVKPKKKKKDKNAGLKLEHIRPTVKPKPASSSNKKHVLSISEPSLETRLLKTSLNIKKAKSNDKAISKKQSKIVSKTQKKNTLLQLATMLKSGSKSSTSENDRLKNLLR